MNESVDLLEERVEIARRLVDHEVTSADTAFQDRTIEREEYREEAVVQKEARVDEEIGLRKTSETYREDISTRCAGPRSRSKGQCRRQSRYVEHRGP